MVDKPLPRDVWVARDLLCADLSRAWRVSDLARMCAVPRRSLEKHFRHFLGCTPLKFLQAERLGEARRKLLRAPLSATVTRIAIECGFPHLGRFAIAYRDHFGESPSATLRFSRARMRAQSCVAHWPCIDRPSIAVLPFERNGLHGYRAVRLSDEIGAALGRIGWVILADAPHARYHLHGRIDGGDTGILQIRTMLFDRSTRRFVWANSWHYALADASREQEWLAELVASALRSVVPTAEANRVIRSDPIELTAWDLSMRALPMVAAIDHGTHGTALELLERAMELSPQDPVPIALAAWCHGLRAAHHFSNDMQVERAETLRLASKASDLSAADPLANAMLSAAYMLAHDLAASEAHARRALSLDGGLAWAWGRLGWVHAYRDETAAAIEHCQIARVLAPSDPLAFVWATGIAAASFEAGCYREAARWYERTLAEEPRAVVLNRFAAPTHLFAGNDETARRRGAILAEVFPDLTIAQVRCGLPHTTKVLDRYSEGLARLGMPLS